MKPAGENTRVLLYSLPNVILQITVNAENIIGSVNQLSYYFILLLLSAIVCMCVLYSTKGVLTAATALQARHTNGSQAILELAKINIFNPSYCKREKFKNRAPVSLRSL